MRVDQLAAMRLFVRIVDTGSFSGAARLLKMSSSNASERMAGLEQTLGVKLLARTTRAVAPTEAGLRYYRVCKRVLEDLEEIEASLTGSQDRLSGRVRVSANVAIARAILLPRLAQWHEEQPDIHVELVISDHRGDFVRDGIDFAVRIGGLEDQDLARRALGRPRRVIVASPAYLEKMGTPETPEDLFKHRLVDFLLPSGSHLKWVFERGGLSTTLAPPSVISVADAYARVELAVAGLGVVQSFLFVPAPALAAGTLKRLLQPWETWGPEISILYPRERNLPARTVATMDAFARWIAEAIAEH